GVQSGARPRARPSGAGPRGWYGPAPCTVRGALSVRRGAAPPPPGAPAAAAAVLDSLAWPRLTGRRRRWLAGGGPAARAWSPARAPAPAYAPALDPAPLP